MTEPTFELAVLCTANRFRSPLAAALVRAHAEGLPVDVRSFAAAGPSGPAALPEARARATPLGVDLEGHVASRLDAAALARADLVLGFERSHVAAAVIDGGAARERTFTLPEFVLLAEAVDVPAESDPVRRARALVAAAHAARCESNAPLPELADPAGGPERGYDDVASALADLSQRLVRVLFGDRERRGA